MMKILRFKSLIPIAFLLALCFVPSHTLAYSEPEVSLEMFGRPIETEVEPIIRNDRTMVPLRVISENLGVQVEWNKRTREVLLNKGGEICQFAIGKANYKKDGRTFNIDAPPIIYKNRTMVPLRAIAEVYGVTVDWSPTIRTVVIGDYFREKVPFETARVERVLSPDTILINGRDGRGEEALRMILVSAPKYSEPYAKEAFEFTQKDLYPGKLIYLERGISERDSSGNLLRYIWTANPLVIDSEVMRSSSFNASLIIEGYARVTPISGDTKYKDAFLEFQNAAKEQGRGIWWTGDPNNNELEKKYKAQFQSAWDYMEKMTAAEYFSAQYAYERANGEIIGDIDTEMYYFPGDPQYKKIELGSAIFFKTEKEALAEGYHRG